MTIHKKQSGLSLVELMISMVIGLLLVSGVVGIFLSTRTGFAQDEKLARLQDEGRFALALISQEISMGGYVGGLLGHNNIRLENDLPAAVADCGPTGWTGADPWVLTLFDEVAGPTGPVGHIDNVVSAAAATAAYSCIGAGLVVPGTDLISIKRVMGAVDTSPAANTVYLRTNGAVGVFHAKASGAIVPTVNAPLPPGSISNYQYRPAVYYIQNFAYTTDDGIPSLCRDRLKGLVFEKECLATGIDDLQIEFGLDTAAIGSRDGIADVFMANPPAAMATSIVAARIFILARSQEEQTAYVNEKSYTVSNSTVLDPNPPNDGYYRRLYTTTVPIRNFANFFATQ